MPMVCFSNCLHRSRGWMSGNLIPHGWHIVTVWMQQSWNNRVRDPVVEQIQRGVPTERVARAVTLGMISFPGDIAVTDPHRSSSYQAYRAEPRAC